jgi:hypothetical protein
MAKEINMFKMYLTELIISYDNDGCIDDTLSRMNYTRKVYYLSRVKRNRIDKFASWEFFWSL